MAFKRCSIGTKGPKLCQENIPHTITPPPSAWTVETRQDGSMLSCSLRQILNLPSECRSRNWDSLDQAMFFQSSIVQFRWACVNCSLRFLFLADWSGTQIKSNQITFIVTSPQHKCLGEWNSYERAPDSAKKQNNSLHMDSTYLQTVQKTMCKIHIHILSTHSVL